MAGRPSNVEREKNDPFATRESMRAGRKLMRALRAGLSELDPKTGRINRTMNPMMLEQFVVLWRELRAAEKHHVDLLRTPPKRRAGAPEKPETKP